MGAVLASAPPAGNLRHLNLNGGETRRQSSGEGFDLRAWAAEHADTFEIVNRLKERSPDVLRGEPGVKQHIECPFEHQHTEPGGTGCFAVNASQIKDAELTLRDSGFYVRCLHNSCADRDRLDMLQGMLDKGWLEPGDLYEEATAEERGGGNDDSDGWGQYEEDMADFNARQRARQDDEPPPHPGDDRGRRPPKFRPIPVGDIQFETAEEWRVKKLLPRRGVAAIYGLSQAFKSFVALDLLLYVAAGWPWAARRSYQAPTSLYCGRGRRRAPQADRRMDVAQGRAPGWRCSVLGHRGCPKSRHR